MTADLSDTLVIGISATALFDLREADAVFREHFETDRARAIKQYGIDPEKANPVGV